MLPASSGNDDLRWKHHVDVVSNFSLLDGWLHKQNHMKAYETSSDHQRRVVMDGAVPPALADSSKG